MKRIRLKGKDARLDKNRPESKRKSLYKQSRMACYNLKKTILIEIEAGNDNFIHSILRMSRNDWVRVTLTNDDKVHRQLRKIASRYYHSRLVERGYNG